METLAISADPEPAVTAVPRRWVHVACVSALTLAFAIGYAVYMFVRDAAYQSGLMDIGIYDQAISGYAHFIGPHSPVVNLPSVGSAGGLQLSDHFTPLLAIIAPLYWIHDGPQTLYVATALLFALAIPPLWVYVRRLHGPAVAYVVVFAFGLSWPIQNAIWFFFHEVAFAVPIMAWMMERAQVGKRLQAFLISLLLLLVKDDMGLVVATFGLYLALKDVPPRRLLRLWRPRELRAFVLEQYRWVYLCIVPFGVLMVEITTKILVPDAGGSPNRDWTYTYFGSTPGQAAKSMIEHPLRAARYFVDPATIKFDTLLWLIVPVLGLCLLSPIILLTVPLIIERFFSSNPMYWKLPLHYNAFVVVFIFCAAADGAYRLAGWLRTDAARLRVPQVWAAGALVVTLATLNHWPFWAMTKGDFWRTNDEMTRAASAALAHVPSGQLVEAAGDVGVHLLSRDKVVQWSYPGDRTNIEAPWIVADVGRQMFPFRTVADQKKDVQLLESQGYSEVFSQGGFVVLHRSGTPLVCHLPKNFDPRTVPANRTPFDLFECRP